MDLEYTPEQQALKDAVRRFCAEQITPERLGAWERDVNGIDGASWKAIARLGWIGLGVGTAAGGSGLGLVELACVLYECGRGLVPRTVINAMRGAWVLSHLDPTAPELGSLVAGDQRVTLAFDEAETRDPSRYVTVAERRGEWTEIRGAKCYVPDGEGADYQIVAAREGRGLSLLLVRGADTKREALRTFDGERQAVVHYDGVRAVRRLGAPGDAAAALERVRIEQTALGLAEMLGGMDAALEMTVAYVKEREQFGQKIAVFQAVQHQVADMATTFTASRHLTWQAITRLAAGTTDGGELSSAAAFVGPAFKRVTLAAHHLHGGAGYVVEHPLHYHAERAQALSIRYTPEGPVLAAVASRLLD